MPIPETFRPLIARLIQATNEHSLSWSEGPAAFMHSASLSNFSVSIQSVRHPSQALQPVAAFPLLFSAVDAKGQMIDQFQVAMNDKDHASLRELFEGAHRSSRKIDEKVSDMMKELDAKLKDKYHP